MTISTVPVVPAWTTTLVTLTVLKPERVLSTSYVPVGKAGNRYLPV
jgi:hypothetical protein